MILTMMIVHYLCMVGFTIFCAHFHRTQPAAAGHAYIVYTCRKSLVEQSRKTITQSRKSCRVCASTDFQNYHKRLWIMSIKVVVPNGNLVFHPGSVITGKVVLVANEPIKYRSVYLLFRGKCYVTWKSGRTRYRSNYECFTIRVNHLTGPLAGQPPPPPGTTQFILPPNTYEFPFSVPVPSGHLPSTYLDPYEFFEEKEAYIKYWLEARVDRPWRFDIKAERVINIHDLVDLNIGQFSRPVRQSREKTICCLCCASGPVNIEAMIDRSGYTCGEKILVTLNVDNNSRRTLPGTSARLMNRITYSCRGRTRVMEKCLSRITGRQHDIQPGQSVRWNNQPLTIPQGLLPTSAACPFITFEYYVVVVVDTPGYSLSSKIKIPVVIGNVPILQRGQQFSMPNAAILEFASEAADLADEPQTNEQSPLLGQH